MLSVRKVCLFDTSVSEQGVTSDVDVLCVVSSLQKGAAALVWGGSEGRVSSSSAMSGPLAGASAGPASPSSAGLVHWMSVMADHDVHYMWNGVEVSATQPSAQIHGVPEKS